LLLGFKTELKINNRQRTQRALHCGVARHAWNWGLGLTKQILDHNKANPQDKIKFPSAVDLHKWLVAPIADMGFHEFRRQLEYKCQLYGSELVVVDRWFPSSKTCSNCGTKKETLTLKERVFQCECCGFEIDRDLNAAINLEKAVS